MYMSEITLTIDLFSLFMSIGCIGLAALTGYLISENKNEELTEEVISNTILFLAKNNYIHYTTDEKTGEIDELLPLNFEDKKN